jgi:hypothetical protein
MTTELTTGAATRPALSAKNKTGLVIAAVLGVLDIVGMVATPEPAPGEQGPPAAVLVAAGVLGVVTVVAAIWSLRTGNRIGSRIVAATRILSAVGALPAFFVEGVPAGLVALAAAGVVLTVVTVWLVLSPPRAGS